MCEEPNHHHNIFALRLTRNQRSICVTNQNYNSNGEEDEGRKHKKTRLNFFISIAHFQNNFHLFLCMYALAYYHWNYVRVYIIKKWPIKFYRVRRRWKLQADVFKVFNSRNNKIEGGAIFIIVSQKLKNHNKKSKIKKNEWYQQRCLEDEKRSVYKEHNLSWLAHAVPPPIFSFLLCIHRAVQCVHYVKPS